MFTLINYIYECDVMCYLKKKYKDDRTKSLKTYAVITSDEKFYTINAMSKRQAEIIFHYYYKGKEVADTHITIITSKHSVI